MDICDALIQELSNRGVQKLFGVPGDYVLSFFDRIERSPLKMMCMAGEEGAGFAADAHARLQGLGVAVVTYGVGALKLMNPVAGAYAEHSPLLVISGAPGVTEQKNHPRLHHSIRAPDTQQRLFSEICVDTARLDSTRTCMNDIRRVLDNMARTSRPGYLEIPRDRLTALLPESLSSEASIRFLPEILEVHRRVAGNIKQWLMQRQRPVILAGTELKQFGLQHFLEEFIEATGLAFATTLTGKSVLDERHPNFIGVYEGAMSSIECRERIENSDGLLILGAPFTDIDTGIFTHHFNSRTTIIVDMEEGLRSPFGNYPEVDLACFIQALAKQSNGNTRFSYGFLNTPQEKFQPHTNRGLSIQRIINAIDSLLEDDTVVVADPGDAMFAAAELHTHASNQFLLNGYWTSMGFAIPAGLGCWAADSSRRPLILLGDGAFLMSANELASLARYKVPAIIVVLDNQGYGTERPMLDGAFNDVAPVDHVALAHSMGIDKAVRARDETGLWKTLGTFMSDRLGPALISLELPMHDRSDALKRLTDELGKRVRHEDRRQSPDRREQLRFNA